MFDKFTTKKDFFYWFVILVYTIIILATKNIGANKYAVNYIGFAGTLASIFLAVAALFYSYLQNITFDNTTKSLNDSAKLIEQVTKDLKNVNQIPELIQSLEQTVCNKNDSNTEMLKNIFSEMLSSNISTNLISNDIIDEKAFSILFKNFNGLIKNCLYLMYKLSESGIGIDIEDFSKVYSQKIGILNDYQFCLGILYNSALTFSYFNLYQLDITTTSNLKVTNFNTQISKILLSYIEEIKLSGEQKNIEFYYLIDAYITARC